MQKRLIWIAVGGFAASAIFLGAAWVAGGAGGIAEIMLRYSAMRRPSCDGTMAGQSMSRDIAWNAGGSVGVAIPSTVRYSPQNGAQVKVTGDAALVPHIRVQNDGTIELDCQPRHLGNARLDITLPGRAFRTFSMAGLTTLILNDIDQEVISMNIAGSSTVEAKGKVERVNVNAAGLSNANLGGLHAKDAELNLAGSSNVEVSAEDNVSVNGVGATTVTLDIEPRSVKTHVIGASRVIHKEG